MYAALNLLNLSQAAPPRPVLPLDWTVLPEVEAAIAGLAGE